MKALKVIAFSLLCAAPALLLTGAGKPQAPTQAEKIARGKYLVGFGDCSACHTPLKFGPNGPEPDMTRYLSGHPEATKLPPPELKPGPWFAATAGMTAWTGPWGISYAANLTPEKSSGLGIWTEAMPNRSLLICSGDIRWIEIF